MQNDALTVARAYHHAWTSRDFEDAGRHLAEVLSVEVPINDYPSKAEFLSAVKFTREMATRVDVLSALGNAGEALLLYDMQLPVTNLRVAEHFTVVDGQITRIRQIHDTAALRAAGFTQPAVG